MRNHLAATALCLGLVTGLAACGDGTEPGDGTAVDTPTTQTPTDDMTETMTDGPTDGESGAPTMSESGMPHGTTIAVEDSDFGEILFDDTGQAIYLFDIEKSDESKCYDACAEAWPPVLTDGEPQAGTGVDQALLGTTERTDGTTQVTYAGHPLYFYAHEAKREVKCHDVFMNGGNWYVVRPDGSAAPPG